MVSNVQQVFAPYLTKYRMDLYDQGCYFANLVPVQALSNPLLRNSACAYAAKQLGRVRGRKAIHGGNVSKQAEMELFPNPQTVNWEYLGAKYYDKAIQLLMEELSNSRRQEMSVTPIPEESVTPQSATQSPRSVPNAPGNKRRGLQRPTNTGTADETLAAVAILCVYEFLDNANTAWSRHLSGTKSLFDMAENEGMMPIRSPTSPGSISERVKPSRARKAAFWNFARQDFLAACKPLFYILSIFTSVCTDYKAQLSMKGEQGSIPKIWAFGELLVFILTSKDLSCPVILKITTILIDEP
jgi:hypothetical protein